MTLFLDHLYYVFIIHLVLYSNSLRTVFGACTLKDCKRECVCMYECECVCLFVCVYAYVCHCVCVEWCEHDIVLQFGGILLCVCVCVCVCTCVWWEIQLNLLVKPHSCTLTYLPTLMHT